VPEKPPRSYQGNSRNPVVVNELVTASLAPGAPPAIHAHGS
jgi:hypothetical protein